MRELRERRLRVISIQLSFYFFLLLFLGVGLWSARKAGRSTRDYLMAGKAVPPLLVGLSAVATAHSGFMFTGMIGTAYSQGLSAIWMLVGWFSGDLAVSLLGLRPILRRTRDERVESYGGLLACWQGDRNVDLQRLIGLLTIFLLTLYASGQLLAGSKAALALIEWPIWLSVILSGFLILAYSMFGGIRASIWTDVVQSVIMIAGMAIMALAGIAHLGGWDGMGASAESLPDGYLDFFPQQQTNEMLLFVFGWICSGLAISGQPHVVTRYMCLDSERNVNRMRLYYYLWLFAFYAATICVGLLSRMMFPDRERMPDEELALLTMARTLLPGVIVGVILAALFAAAMSTADSIILTCSAALTNDLAGGGRKVWFAKSMTALVLVAAGLLAIFGDQSVFNVVLEAWGAQGSAFAPLILFFICGMKCSRTTAMAACLLGLASFIVTNRSLVFEDEIARIVGDIRIWDVPYPVTVGIITGSIVLWTVSIAGFVGRLVRRRIG